MGKLYITEYVRQAKDNRGQAIAAGEEPAIAIQTVTYTTSTQSAALNSKTRFVRVHTDAICSILFSANPTATTDHTRLPANQTEFFGVTEESVRAGLKIAAVANT